VEDNAPQFTLEPCRRAGSPDENGNAFALIRAGLLPQLARMMMNRLVQALLSQRGQLLQTQEQGTTRLEELERRFVRIQVQLQSRINQYEARIQNLETELAAREEENRELTRSNILLARKIFEPNDEMEIESNRLSDADLLLRS
jgi:predicted nuclease with TOPRIM domain